MEVGPASVPMLMAWHFVSDPQALSSEQADNRTVKTTRRGFMVFLAEELVTRAMIMVQQITK